MRMSYISSPGNWVVVLTAVVITSLCVGLHYEVLNLCNRFLSKLSHQRRRRVLLLMFIILTTHVAEIWLFGLGYLSLVRYAGLGALKGLPTTELPDFVYFSAVTYATVGFGDVVPVGAIRFLAGMESLTGFVMITWSASYTFLEMQRDWRSS
jgi:ion channel